MNALSHILSEPDLSLYRLESTWAPDLLTFCASTPLTRRILNRPEIAGVEFTRNLQEAVTTILRNFPDPVERNRMREEGTGVVNFLRSGLNFGIRDALYDAWGFNAQLTSFITSQRARDQFGRWFIRDDAYRKIELPYDSTIFIGEIVATGVTMNNGLQIVGRMAKNLGRPIRNLVFFTIGCHKIEKALSDFHHLMRQTFPKYNATYLFYLEGKFHLADSRTKAAIKVQGTDLMRTPALLAPEFELEQFEPARTALERCVIYDGGARAFNPHAHFLEVASYWREMAALGERGMSLSEALAERWPCPEYFLDFQRFAQEKNKQWRGVGEKILEDLYQAAGERRSRAFKLAADEPGSLTEPARARLQSLEARTPDPGHP